MKLKIELTEWEIKAALKSAIKEKTGIDVPFASEIKLNGSTRFKKRAVRKDMERIIASVEVHR